MSDLPPNTRASFAHDVQAAVRALDATLSDRVIAKAGAIWPAVERTPAPSSRSPAATAAVW